MRCAPGEIACDGVCIDPQNDPTHCGTCATVCSSGVCTGGTCGAGLCGNGMCDAQEVCGTCPADCGACEAAPSITRGPYLQNGSPTAVTVRWRTDRRMDSVVAYGTDASALNQLVRVQASVKEHEVRLSGLSAATRYYYAFGASAATLRGGDAEHTFRTSPTPGTAQPTRIWVLGDSGTANGDARAVRDAFLGYMGGSTPDLWIMLGDNAYNDGRDSEYQRAVFDMYPQTLRSSVLWSTLGNHDGHSADSASQSGPYYDIFTLPTEGEAGGVPSGTEAYYSFDYANVHFVCLDSYDSNRAQNGPMLTWMVNDLMATNATWIVAFFHHPPYSKGSHDSDSERQLVDMREQALPLLETYGVDMVLSGHSHSYERSMYIHGHYGRSSSFSPSTMAVDSGDGQVGRGGAYQRPAASQRGAVYVVAGSSGKVSGGSLNHPVMITSQRTLGSMVLDVEAARLSALFLDSRGSVKDRFTIQR